jgi:hypothetical protein
LDWPLAINRNSEALRRIVAALFAMMGAATAVLASPGLSRRSPGEGGRGAFTLPRHVYAAIMLILRPAESAVRRLIVIAARGLSLKPRAARPLPAGLASFGEASTAKIPAFCLFDPLKSFSRDDYDNNALPHFVFHSGEDAGFHWQQSLPPDEPVNAARLFVRLRALRHALNDLPRQARRLARWQSRRDVLLKSNAPFKPMRITPFRPGLPPGWRERRIHEVDDVLRECHGLAGDVLNGPDTG